MEINDLYVSEYCFTSLLHNHGNIATEGSPKPGLWPALISNGFSIVRSTRDSTVTAGLWRTVYA